MDSVIRIQEFFEQSLMGKSAPEWMPTLVNKVEAQPEGGPPYKGKGGIFRQDPKEPNCIIQAMFEFTAR